MTTRARKATTPMARSVIPRRKAAGAEPDVVDAGRVLEVAQRYVRKYGWCDAVQNALQEIGVEWKEPGPAYYEVVLRVDVKDFENTYEIEGAENDSEELTRLLVSYCDDLYGKGAESKYLRVMSWNLREGALDA